MSHCVLESALYGNATYIIPKENWEVLSQKMKKELLDEKIVIEKVIHSFLGKSVALLFSFGYNKFRKVLL